MAASKIYVNFLSESELLEISSVGPRIAHKLFRSVKAEKGKSEPDMDMSDVVSVLVHNLPSVPSHVYTLDDQFREAENQMARTLLLLTQVKMDMLTSKMSRDDTVGIDTQPAAIPKVP